MCKCKDNPVLTERQLEIAILIAEGYSNKEIISAAESVVGKTIPVVYGPRREGDPAMLTAEADNFKAVSGWQPKYNIIDVIQHAWNWYNV